MSEAKTYNGWHNYETWAVNLWMSNDQGSSQYWEDAAQSCWDEAEADKTFSREEQAGIDLADRLKEEFEGGNPLTDQASVWSDLLTAALSEVDWLEIAEHLIEDVEKTEEPAEVEEGE